MTDPIPVLEYFREQATQPLDNVGKQILAIWLSEKLSDCPPFSSLNTGSLTTPMGSETSCGGGALVAARWAVDRLAEGMPTNEVLKLATQQIEENAPAYKEITRLVGVSVETGAELLPGVWIMPNSELPESSSRQQMFSDMDVRASGLSTDAAVVFDVKEGPVFFPTERVGELDKACQKLGEKFAERTKLRIDIMRACAMCSKEFVGLFGTYAELERPYVCASNAGLHFNLADTPLTWHSVTIAVADIKAALAKIQNFKAPEAMGLAIDRLRQSRRWAAKEDKAIDLGIALEVALMHDLGNERAGEMSHKIGIRAGWLMGTSPDSRRAALKTAQAIYSRRSMAVHTGKIEKKGADATDFRPAVDAEFVRALLDNLLDRGAFPDWATLVVGGAQ